MRNAQLHFRRATVLGLVLSLLMPFSPVTVGEAVAQESNTLDTILPPSLNGNAANFSNIFTSCGYGGLIPAAIEQGAKIMTKSRAKGETGIGINTECPVSDEPPEGPYACEKFIDAEGLFAEAKFTILKTAVANSRKAVSCKLSKLQAIQAELECFKRGYTALAQQLQSIKQEYTRNIQEMQKTTQMMTSYLADRDKQITEVSTKLDGSGSIGTPGIVQMKQMATDFLNGARMQIESSDQNSPGLRLRVKKAKLDRIRLDEDARIRTMALTRDCLENETVPGYRCEVNGPEVSATKYAECIYQQYSMTGKDGVVQESLEVRKRAEAAGATLKGALGQILAGIPSDADVPKNPQAGADDTSSKQNYNYLEPGSVPWSRLERFKLFIPQNGGTVQWSARAVLQQRLNSCYARFDAQVKKEKKFVEGKAGRSNSKLAVFTEEIKQFEQVTKSLGDKYLSDVERIYQQMHASLTGSQVSLNAAQCKNASPDRMLACAEDGFNQIDDLLNGKTPASNQKMHFKANDPKLAVTIECRGVMGCETAMNNLRTNLRDDFRKVQLNKSNYINKANMDIVAFTEKMAQNFSPQTQYLKEQLVALNTSLQSLGEDGLGIDIQDVEGEQLQPSQGGDGPGVYGIPNDILALIGGKTQPKMLKMDNFANSISGMGRAVERLAEKDKKAKVAEVALLSKAEECKQKDVQTLLSSYKSSLDRLRGSGCELDYCENNSSPLSNLHVDLETALGENARGIVEDIGSILNGVGGDCKRAVNNYRDEAAQVEKLRGQIADLERRELEKRNEMTTASTANNQAIAVQASTEVGQITSQLQSYRDRLVDSERTLSKLKYGGRGGESATLNCESVAQDMEPKKNRIMDRVRTLTGSKAE